MVPWPCRRSLWGHPPALPAQNEQPRGPAVRTRLPTHDLPTQADGRGLPAGCIWLLGAAMLPGDFPGHGRQIKETANQERRFE